MPQLTITEALAEIKTIRARVAKKRAGIQPYIVRDSRLKDPMVASGGSDEWVKRERQAVKDLEDRTIKIRSAIQAKNLETKLTIEGQERSLTDWLNWRREIATPDDVGGSKHFLGQMILWITTARANAQKQGVAVVEKETASDKPQIVVNVNEADLHKEADDMEKILGVLDGKLSLLNATTTIDV